MDSLAQFSVPDVLEEYKSWILGPDKPSAPVRAGKKYSLKNKKPRKFLQYEKQTWGINLGWTDDAEPDTARKVDQWFFTRKGSSKDAIEYGETIAIGYDDSYIRYEKRTVGINLGWSDDAVFEWQILGGRGNTAVKTFEWIALINLKAKTGGEPLIFFDRTAGGDIGWPSSQTWGDQLKQKAWEAAQKAAMEALKAYLGG